MNNQNSPNKTLHIHSETNIQNLTNKELYTLCKQYGKNVRKWSREFGFLLPEVAKRNMYRKYRCTSIYEFAAKLAGMSRDITARIFNLSQKLADKPIIWNEFKKYGWTKLMVIADTVTIDTQEFWLDKLRKLPRPALQEYLKVWKKNNKIPDSVGYKPFINNLFTFVAQENHETQVNGLPKPEIEGSTELCYETPPVNKKIFKKMRIMVDSETEFEFKKFKQAMEKEKKEALTMGETLKLLLRKIKELENAKAQVAINSRDIRAPIKKLATGSAADDNSDDHINLDNTARPDRSHHRDHKHSQHRRHIKFIASSIRERAISQIKKSGPISRKASRKLQTSIIAAYNGMCAFPGCNEPHSELHHPDRFSLKKSHQRIYPLCRLHHQLAHAGLIKNEELTIENWQVDLEKKTAITGDRSAKLSGMEGIFSMYQTMEKQRVDQIVRDHWIT